MSKVWLKAAAVRAIKTVSDAQLQTLAFMISEEEEIAD